MRIVLFVFLFFSLKQLANGQSQKSCASHEHFEQKLQNDSILEKYYRTIQKNIRAYTETNTKEQNGNIIIIPVVFHIIHNGDAIGDQENISMELITEQIVQLNADYSRTNSDAANTPGAFLSVAANTEIQFCLAETDENGYPTSGIIRTHINTLSGVSESDCWTPSYIEEKIVTPLIWNRDLFLNIFTVVGIDEETVNGCDFFSTLGFGQFPGGSALTDAIVVSFFTVGSLVVPNPLFPNFLGRTCTHEVGHWLNLNHVWGPNNGGCQQDDGIIDTPLQFESSSGCSTFPILDSCTPGGDGIMFMNYMDYSDDNCLNLFTAGQRGMMRAAINSARPGLLSSPCNAENVLSLNASIELSISPLDNSLLLNWTIYSESKIERIDIEKGSEMSNMTLLSSVTDCDISGSKSCLFIDDSPLIGLNFYRLKLMYADDSFQYSEIEVANYYLENNLTIYPNPSKGILNIETSNSAEPFNMKIYNNIGKLIHSCEINALQTTYNLEYLDHGVYTIVISNTGMLQINNWYKL